MVRSLWTAATGMIAQQTNLDTISNNLANVNTTGYKTETAEFKSLLYQSLQTKSTSSDGTAKPVAAQVGLGVRNSSIVSSFEQGNTTATDSDSAFAIQGKGFFGIRGADGKTYYTRNGNFQWVLGTQGIALTTTDGYPVQDSTGKPITLSSNYSAANITITGDGKLCYPDANNNAQPIGIQIGVVQFDNPAGLTKAGNSLFLASAASGNPINESTSTAVAKSNITQGYLEGSNVQVVDEMVNMIVAQRAYEMNSKVIQASDDMMSQANQLRR